VKATTNTRNLLLTTDEACQRGRQVMSAFRTSCLALWRSSPPDGLDRGSESLRVIRCELEPRYQACSGVAIRVRCAAFQLLNPAGAQPSAFGELLLRQPSSEAMLRQQRAEGCC